MGSEEEDEELISIATKLPLLYINTPPPTIKSTERSGMLTPPLHASGAVPFRWEDQPGKPKPCTAIVPLNNVFTSPKCLELPPRLLLDPNNNKLPSPSPTTESSYSNKSSRFVSSFRMVAAGGDCYGSFRAPLSPEWVVLTKKVKDKRTFLGSWKKSKREVGLGLGLGGGSSYVFPSSSSSTYSLDYEDELNVNNKTQGNSFSLLNDSKSHFWGNIYEGLKKQVIVPWRGRKSHS
jgi:hypothetical protein